MTAHDPLCGFSDRHREDCTCPFHDPATCLYCIPLRAARANERERIVREIASIPRPWSELTDQYRRGWEAALQHALRIARGGT